MPPMAHCKNFALLSFRPIRYYQRSFVRVRITRATRRSPPGGSLLKKPCHPESLPSLSHLLHLHQEINRRTKRVAIRLTFLGVLPLSRKYLMQIEAQRESVKRKRLIQQQLPPLTCLKCQPRKLPLPLFPAR